MDNGAEMSELSWAEAELIEVMRIIGPPDGTDDLITYAMKFSSIRRMVEADEDKYLELARRASNDEARDFNRNAKKQ